MAPKDGNKRIRLFESETRIRLFDSEPKNELELLRLLKIQIEEALCNTNLMYLKSERYELIQEKDLQELNITLDKLNS